MSDETSTPLPKVTSEEFTVKHFFRAVLLLSAIIAPFLVSSPQMALLLEIFFLAMYAMSLDFLIGYTGYVSFGHCAFFGISAYTTGLVLLHATDMLIVAILAGIAAAALVGIPIGYFSLKRHGIYFAMLTLAFSQILHVLVLNDIWNLTGGSDGLPGLPRGTIGIPSMFSVILTETGYYYLVLAAIILLYLTLKRIINSPFGSVMLSIRENEVRAEYAGYNVDRYKLVAFVISGIFGGLAGALYMPYYRVLTPDLFAWTFSGEAIVMVIVGGMGTLVGPIFGAILFVGLRELVSPFLTDWTIVLGFLFIIFILFLPNGLISAWRASIDRTQSIIRKFVG